MMHIDISFPSCSRQAVFRDIRPERLCFFGGEEAGLGRAGCSSQGRLYLLEAAAADAHSQRGP